MRQKKLRWHGVEEIALIPETREEYEAAMRSRARTVCLTMEQIREWNLAVEAVPMSEEAAAAAIFGTDQEFYELVLEEEAAESPPESELELDPRDVPVGLAAEQPGASAEAAAGEQA